MDLLAIINSSASALYSATCKQELHTYQIPDKPIRKRIVIIVFVRATKIKIYGEYLASLVYVCVHFFQFSYCGIVIVLLLSLSANSL